MLDHSLDFLLLPVSEYRLPHELLPSAFHEKAGMSQVFLPVRMFLFFSSSL
jgi:hypothetical protein